MSDTVKYVIWHPEPSHYLASLSIGWTNSLAKAQKFSSRELARKQLARFASQRVAGQCLLHRVTRSGWVDEGPPGA